MSSTAHSSATSASSSATSSTATSSAAASSSASPNSLEWVEIHKTLDIAAPLEVVWAAMLDELGPDAQLPDGSSYPFKLETRPGGRWFRDLGADSGHLWGFVQVIKPPTLLEITGPLMMSYPAINHLQYRFTAIDGGTRLTFTHRGMGTIKPEHRGDGVNEGWGSWNERIKKRAEAKGK